MKKPFTSLTLIFLLASIAVSAQQISEVLDSKKHRVIIQYNNSDSSSQIFLTRQLDYIRTSWPNSIIEVVCLNDGLDLVMITQSKVRKEVTDWMTKGVVFAACNSSMRVRSVHRSDLLPNTKVIPSAPIELALKQEQGWAYFRGGE